MKIAKVFGDVHMGLGHKGLIDLCKKKFNFDISELPKDQVVFFINRANNKIKAIGAKGWVVGYIRPPNEQKIMLEAIQYLPETFGGGQFDYPEALRKALGKRLVSRANRLARPLEVYRAKERSGLTARLHN